MSYAPSIPSPGGIVDEARDGNLSFPEAEDFEALKGKGATASVQGRRIAVVSPGYLEENSIDIDGGKLTELEAEGKTVVYVLVDEKVAGAIGLADIIREESREAVRRLQKMNIQVMMLTGDAENVARWVAGELDLDEYYAEVLPEKKAEKIKEVKKGGRTTALVGDGINDAPALV